MTTDNTQIKSATMKAVQKFLSDWDAANITGCKATYEKARRFLRVGGWDTETHNRLVGIVEWHLHYDLNDAA